MAEQPDSSAKTHAPTAKRLREAERKGDVFLSRELTTFLVMSAGAAWLIGAGGWLLLSFGELMATGLALDRRQFFAPDFATQARQVAAPAILPLSSLLLATLLAAIAGTALTGSAGFRWASLAWRGERLSPLAGMKRMFGQQALAELAKAVAKTILILAFGALGLWPLIRDLESPIILDVPAAFAAIGGHGALLFAWLAAALLIVALIDLPLQYRQRLGRLKMSLQELRDEHKQDEGSPELRQTRRQRQYALATGSLRTAVGEATVVLTNPTHFAIALRYRPEEDPAPLVTARGRGETAAAIRELAVAAKIPVLSYPQLARALYYGVRTGNAVREEFYQPLAIILAWLFELDRQAGGMAMQPNVETPDALRVDADGRPERGN